MIPDVSNQRSSMHLVCMCLQIKLVSLLNHDLQYLLYKNNTGAIFDHNQANLSTSFNYSHIDSSGYHMQASQQILFCWWCILCSPQGLYSYGLMDWQNIWTRWMSSRWRHTCPIVAPERKCVPQHEPSELNWLHRLRSPSCQERQTEGSSIILSPWQLLGNLRSTCLPIYLSPSPSGTGSWRRKSSHTPRWHLIGSKRLSTSNDKLLWPGQGRSRAFKGRAPPSCTFCEIELML